MHLRGEIYKANPSEWTGNKTRPVVVVSNNSFNSGQNILVVPFFSNTTLYVGRRCMPFFSAGEGGLEKDCVARVDLICQVRRVDVSSAKIGELTEPEFHRILNAMDWLLGLPPRT